MADISLGVEKIDVLIADANLGIGRVDSEAGLIVGAPEVDRHPSQPLGKNWAGSIFAAALLILSALGGARYVDSWFANGS
jgi:hypothetical protein